jgi:hypothetical protein
VNKAQFLAELHAENDQFEALLTAIGAERMTQPIAPDQWSIKDIVAHLAAWRRRTVQRLRAAAGGAALPPPPWPAHLTESETDEEINAWLHAQTVEAPVEDILAASRQVFDDLATAAAALPEEGLFEPGRFDWLGGEPLTAKALFGHFHEEHEADMRRWKDAA